MSEPFSNPMTPDEARWFVSEFSRKTHSALPAPTADDTRGIAYYALGILEAHALLSSENEKLAGMVKEKDAEIAALKKAGREVMETLQQHGPSIVPHLIDTDENAGQRLRELCGLA